jgi:hypothetical protein
MKQLFSAIIFIVVASTAVFAQYETGMGARAFSLANNHTALSSGVADLYWNPGAMAFSVSREFQGSLYGIKLKSASDFFNNSSEADLQRPGIGNAGFSFALPASRGGMSIAVSYSNPIIFDDVYRFSGAYQDINNDTLYSERTFRTTGGLNYWTGGFGVQVAQNLGVGLAASLVTGRGNADGYLHERNRSQNTASTIDDYTAEERYVGYDVRAGLFYKLSMFRFGMRLVMPQVIRMSDYINGTSNGDFTDQTDDFNLYSPYKGAVGMSAILRFVTISAEVRGTTPYDFIFPVENIPDDCQAGYFKTGAGIGIEVPLIVVPIILRAGYSYDDYDLNPYAYDFVTHPDNVKDFTWSDGGMKVSRNLNRITAGFGYTTASMSFDLAYGFSTWGITTNRNLEQVYELHRILASFAVRF